MADAIGLVASIAQLVGVAIKTFEYISAVKNASKDQSAIVREILTLVNLLIQLRDKAEELGQRQAHEQWLTAASALVPLLNTLHDDLQEVATRLHGRSDSKSAKVAQSVLWPWKEKHCRELLARIGRLEGLIQIALQQTSMDLLDAVKQHTDLLPHIDSNLSALSNLVVDVDKERHHHIRSRVLQWVSPLDPSIRHDTVCRDRMAGTGTWFLQSPVFQAWLKARGDCLWCPGIPGAGKTVIMSTVIDHLNTIFQGNQKAGVAYIYFNYNEQSQLRLSDAIRSIYRQIMSPLETVPDDLMTAWEYGQARGKPPADSKILSLLEYEANQRDIYLVLDALDECFADDLLPLLQTIRKVAPDLNLIMSSRPLDNIKGYLEKYCTLEISADREEMENYVRHRLQKNHRFAKVTSKDPEIGEEIAKIAVDKAQNMFLLLRLHMDSLVSQGTIRGIRRQLASLPEKLDATYDQAMERICAQEQYFSDLARQSLYWISHACRPLSLTELSHMIAVEVGKPEFDPENLPIDIDDIVSSCAGLVMVDSTDQIVRFVHYTTQEYFVRVRGAMFPLACLDIAKKCLTYLLYENFYQKPHERDALLETHPAIGYVACHWGKHTRGEPDQDSEVRTMALLLLKKQYRPFDEFMDTCNPQPADRDSRPDQPWALRHTTSGLHIAARFGLNQVLSILLEKQIDINSNDEHGQTALHWASIGGHVDTVVMLLDLGAEVNAKTTWNHATALILASARGLLPLVQVLVQRGADVNSSCLAGEPGGAALHEACGHGYIDVVIYLLDHEAKFECDKTLNQAGEVVVERMSSLYWAMRSGIDLFQLLIDRGASTGGSDCWSCVRAAIDMRRPDFIDVLKAANADILHTPDGEEPNVIHALRDSYVPCVATFHTALCANCGTPSDVWAMRMLTQQEWFREVQEGPNENFERDPSGEDTLAVRKNYKRTTPAMYSERNQRPYVGIILPRDFSSVEQIAFTFESHDQGWSDTHACHNTYLHSYTWFHLIVQFHSEPSFPCVEHDLQHNFHASTEFRTHTVVFRRNGTNPYVGDTLSRLKPGDILHIFARALYPGWVNFVRRVEVEIAGQGP